jgi:xylulokinase
VGNFLVIDCGTSACRAATVNPDGRLLSHSRVPLNIQRPAPGMAEVDIDHVWGQVVRAVTAERQRHADTGIDAVGVSAMLGYVFLDGAGEPLAPAIIWMDNRAENQAADIRRRIPAGELQRRTGRRISPELLAPKLLWLADHRPAVFRRIRRVIGLKDEIIRRLTGSTFIDVTHMDYSLLFDVRRGCLDEDVAAALGIPAALFPEPRRATDSGGTVKATVAPSLGLSAGTPVAVGSSDGTTAMYGGGVLEADTAVLVSGTTDVMMTATRTWPADPAGVLSTNTGMTAGTFLTGGAMGLGAGALKRVAELLQVPLEAVPQQVAQRPPGAAGLLFFPGLTGERAPYWEPAVCGGMVGLRTHHDAGHILRAVMEGTAYRTLSLLKTLQQNGLNPVRLRVVGGGAAADAWNRIRCDVTGHIVEKPTVGEATLLGAAMFCRVAVDPAATLETLGRRWVTVDTRYEPDAAVHRRYRPMADLFDGFITANCRLYRQLARFSR